MVNKKEYVKVLLACVVNQTDSLHRLFCVTTMVGNIIGRYVYVSSAYKL